MLLTERLILREWTTQDVILYYHINQDPKVIEFLPGSLTVKQIEDFVMAKNLQLKQRGFTLWAAELKETRKFIGFIGLNYVKFEAHFTPAVEVGWRLGSEYWGNGYATEGAKFVINYGFKNGLKEIVSFTVPKNIRSIRVMERIGMEQDLKGDFMHPNLEVRHKLSKHILYRINSTSLSKNCLDKTYCSKSL